MEYVFFVDGRKYDWPKASITGPELRAVVPGLNPTFIIIKEMNDGPDVAVTDSSTYSLDAPEPPQFYTAPPATFGSNTVHPKTFVNLHLASDPLRELVLLKERARPEDFPIEIRDGLPWPLEVCMDEEELDGFVEGWMMGEEMCAEA